MERGRFLRDKFRRLLVVQGALGRAKRPCGMPLNLPHAHALLELKAESLMTISELATRLQIDRTNVSRLCQRMESLGELERIEHPKDKRAKLLELTEKGKVLAEHVDLASTKHFQRVIELLGESSSDVLVALSKLEQVLSEISEMTKRGQ